MKIRSLLAFTFAASQLLAADWPQWRGPARDDVSKETGLLKQWPEGGPKQLWVFKNAGMGYSGPAIAGGKFFTLGTRDNGEILLTLDANTGKELWVAKLGEVLKNGWGDGPRGTLRWMAIASSRSVATARLSAWRQRTARKCGAAR